MGKVLSVATRPFRNYNVRQRAHKEMDVMKGAPSFKSTEEMIRIVREKYPDIVVSQQTKNEKLQTKLKNVYVTSRDPSQLAAVPTEPGKPRPLPSNRRIAEDSELGVADPITIPVGKFSLRQALQFISEHQGDPENVTSKTIALKYNLDVEATNQVLEHFSTFRLHIPMREGQEEVPRAARLITSKTKTEEPDTKKIDST